MRVPANNATIATALSSFRRPDDAARVQAPAKKVQTQQADKATDVAQPTTTKRPAKPASIDAVISRPTYEFPGNRALQRFNSPPEPTSPPPPSTGASIKSFDDAPAGDATAGADPTPTLEGLIDAWGLENAQYDLNGDNTVDVQDLSLFIQGWPHDGGESDTEDSGNVQQAQGQPASLSAPSPVDTSTLETVTGINEETPDFNGTGALTLDELMEVWGQNSPKYDLNQDQTVDVQDLSLFIQNFPDYAGDSPSQAQAPGQGLDGFSIERFADRLIESLADAGFADEPPTNLNSLVDALKLDQSNRRELFSRLGAQFPNGLGINLFG